MDMGNFLLLIEKAQNIADVVLRQTGNKIDPRISQTLQDYLWCDGLRSAQRHILNIPRQPWQERFLGNLQQIEESESQQGEQKDRCKPKIGVGTVLGQ